MLPVGLTAQTQQQSPLEGRQERVWAEGAVPAGEAGGQAQAAAGTKGSLLLEGFHSTSSSCIGQTPCRFVLDHQSAGQIVAALCSEV